MPTPIDFPLPEGALGRLSHQLGTAAGATQLLDVAYRTLDSPLGTLLLAATERGLVRVAFATENFDAVLCSLAATLSPRILQSSARLDAPAHQLEEYFSGSRTSFDLPIDGSLLQGFRGQVQQYLPHIGYGHTVSYAELAQQVGRPRASRAVGTACATNPLPIVFPCHRVIRSDGTLGGYLGGLPAKYTLLALETNHVHALR